LFATTRHQDLIRGIVQTVIIFEFVNDGLFEFSSPVHCGVFGHAGIHRTAGSGFDMVRGVEIRFASTQANHIFAGCLQGIGDCSNCESG
jgi:hypothetical protein